MNLNWTGKFWQGYSYLRSLHYFVQFQTLNGISQLLPFSRRLGPNYDSEKIKSLILELDELYQNDAQNIANQIYPPQVLKPESAVEHALRVPKILIDGLKINWRRSRKKTKDFSGATKEKIKELPDYYQRNFHFQTDGYMSTESAKLYDHQVELLFLGAAGAMRRILLAPLKKALAKNANGEGLKFLEIGCGTGTMTRDMHLTFPKAKIIASDISSPYLKIARQRLTEYDNISFLEAAGETLPFQNESFDVIYCVYLFHEMPLDVRKKILTEAYRLLKPGGYFGYVDSLQLNDKPHLNHALEQFPKDFHEPFYTNYTKTLMSPLVKAARLNEITTGYGFLSKFGLFQKSGAPDDYQ